MMASMMYCTVRRPVTRVSISFTGEIGWPAIGPPHCPPAMPPAGGGMPYCC